MRRTTAPVVAVLAASAVALVAAPARADWSVTDTRTSAPMPTSVVRTANAARTPEALPGASPTTPSPMPGSGYCWPVECAPRPAPSAGRAAAAGALVGTGSVTRPPAAARRVAGHQRPRAAAVRHHAADPGRRWVVGPGDTLSLVAAVWGVSVERVAARNGIGDPNVIRVGQVLHRPGGAR